MFKGVRPYFWWGMGSFYSFVFLMMILEMAIPGLNFHFRLGGLPLAFIYTHVIGLSLLPLVIAYVLWRIPDREEKNKIAQAKEMNTGGR
ncbi:MAG TPA: hypothetical protein VLH18_05300 [Candidatus Limnocylindrales bacterium]|nr:hypothetical protein [Candidatus Limnocylindrales bacterium]